MTRYPRLLPVVRAIGRWQINHAIDDPELRRKVTPRDEFGCKRIMLTDDWYPTLTRPNVELVTERIAAVTPSGIRTRTAASAPPTCSCWPPASRRTTSWRRWRSPARAAARWREAWGDVPRAYLGITVPGFPNLFLLYGPNTNGGTGSVRYTIEAAMGHVIAALDELDRADARRIEVRPRPPRRSTASCAPRSRARSGTRGCTNWYVDENGYDPNQWPWQWANTAAARRRSSPRTTRWPRPYGRSV